MLGFERAEVSETDETGGSVIERLALEIPTETLLLESVVPRGVIARRHRSLVSYRRGVCWGRAGTTGECPPFEMIPFYFLVTREAVKAGEYCDPTKIEPSDCGLETCFACPVMQTLRVASCLVQSSSASI